jgi:hypothetical protein
MGEEDLQLVADDPAHLGLVLVLPRAGPLVGPEAERAHHAPGREELRVAEQPRPQLEIAGQPVALVELTPRALPERSPPERRFLLYVAMLSSQESQPAPAARRIGGHGRPVGREVAGLRGQPLHVRERAEHVRQEPQRAPVQHVVGVQPAHDLARGAGEALVEGVGMPAVRLAGPGGEAALVAADHVHGPVRAAAVNDHVFQVGIPLVQDGPDGLLDGGHVVQAWRDHADARRRHVTTT